MKTERTILITGLFLSVIIFTGCSKNNNNVNANNQNESVNQVAVANGNTNTTNENINSEDIDTSDWQTYTNEEYEFSFSYPKEWGEIIVKKSEESQYQNGIKTLLIFNNDISRNSNGLTTATISFESLDYQFTGPSDGEDIFFKNVDLNLSEDQLNKKLINESIIELTTKKISTRNNIQGLYIFLTKKQLDGSFYSFEEYLFPKFSLKENIHLRISGEQEIKSELYAIINSISIQ